MERPGCRQLSDGPRRAVSAPLRLHARARSLDRLSTLLPANLSLISPQSATQMISSTTPTPADCTSRGERARFRCSSKTAPTATDWWRPSLPVRARGLPCSCPSGDSSLWHCPVKARMPRRFACFQWRPSCAHPRSCADLRGFARADALFKAAVRPLSRGVGSSLHSLLGMQQS